MRDLPGVPFSSICSQSHEITSMTPSCSQPAPLPPAPHPLPYSSCTCTLPAGHFLACWMEGDLGTYQLAMMSFLSFFNKTKQNKKNNAIVFCLFI